MQRPHQLRNWQHPQPGAPVMTAIGTCLVSSLVSVAVTITLLPVILASVGPKLPPARTARPRAEPSGGWSRQLVAHHSQLHAVPDDLPDDQRPDDPPDRWGDHGHGSGRQRHEQLRAGVGYAECLRHRRRFIYQNISVSQR